MRYLLVVSLVMLCAAVALLLMADEAEAAATGYTCSTVLRSGVGSVRLTVSTNVEDNCLSGGSPIIVEPGASTTLTCSRLNTGTVTVEAPDTVMVYFTSDDTSFPNTAPPGAFHSTTPSGTCSVDQSVPFWCTDNGQSSGNPRYGIVRITVRMQRTTAPAYDIGSDSADYGIIRCSDITLSSYVESNPQTTYIAGDTIGYTVASASASYNSDVNTRTRVQCGVSDIILGTDYVLGTAGTTRSTTIIGTRTVWPTGCALTSTVTSIGTAGLSGYTSTPIHTYKTVGQPAGVSCTSLTCTFTTGDVMDRTLSHDPACVYALNGTLTTQQYERLEGVRSTCGNGWVNARGGSVGNNVASTGYYTRGGNNDLPDTQDYPSTDFLTGGIGSSQFTSTSLITAHPGTYRTGIETYSTTNRLPTELLGWGVSTATHNLTYNRTLDTVLNTRLELSTTNVSSFTIGTDEHWVTPKGLRNVRGEALSGVALTCDRHKPLDPNVFDSWPYVTNGAGDGTPTIEVGTSAPVGTWSMECYSDAAGNSMFFNYTFNYESAFSADTKLEISLDHWSNETGIWVNVSAQARFYDPTTDNLESIFPDDIVLGNLLGYNEETGTYDVFAQRSILNKTGETSTPRYFTTVNVSNMTVPREHLTAVVRANLSNRTFVDSASIVVDRYVYDLEVSAWDYFNGQIIVPLLRPKVWDRALGVWINTSANLTVEAAYVENRDMPAEEHLVTSLVGSTYACAGGCFDAFTTNMSPYQFDGDMTFHMRVRSDWQGRDHTHSFTFTPEDLPNAPLNWTFMWTPILTDTTIDLHAWVTEATRDFSGLVDEYALRDVGGSTPDVTSGCLFYRLWEVYSDGNRSLLASADSPPTEGSCATPSSIPENIKALPWVEDEDAFSLSSPVNITGTAIAYTLDVWGSHTNGGERSFLLSQTVTVGNGTTGSGNVEGLDMLLQDNMAVAEQASVLIGLVALAASVTCWMLALRYGVVFSIVGAILGAGVTLHAATGDLTSPWGGFLGVLGVCIGLFNLVTVGVGARR